MITFTSTLPEDIIADLNKLSDALKVPKNKIIERALSRYLEQIERQMYIRSYRELADDEDILSLAEEGLEYYEAELKKWDETR